ncbi:S41 family peptidase [Roseburia sp. 1XD42-69]|uniref:S41 family peptidase n=1 Tax=Roseburia sp. 1XD42-69 TaxID=2320088 RepID=UPI0013148F80|nr:S41 family peptidase [Roseburia sp. 1XD42-69]MCX4319005.1 S41 family peptidase [Lachnospiraceae bacterium]
MRKKVKKKFIVILSLTFLVLLLGGVIGYNIPISFGGSYPPLLPALPPDTLLTKEQVFEDREAAVRFVENVHPYFILEEDLSAYQRARQDYMDSTEKEMTAEDFKAATAEYLCFFQDGHTCIWWEEQEYLSLNGVYQKGHTYVGKNGEITDVYVTSIGGRDMEKVYQAIDRVIPAENEKAKEKNRDNYATGRNILKLAGAEISGDSVLVTYSDGSEEECMFREAEKSSGTEQERLQNTWIMDEDVFVINFVECVDDDNLKSIAKELESAVKNGCGKVLMDVRGNGGGNSNACKRLLTAMGMEAPEYDMLVRFSKEAKEQAGYLRSRGSVQWKGSDKCKGNEDVELTLLCDRDTFSSATMLLVWVRDGNLGKIVGEASSNAPNSYGDILYLSLPNSHLDASVSHKQFIRPDEKDNSRMLIPDIETSSGEAYEKAMELFGDNT